jgi:enoyl-CoA hydratase/carnithine racemase
LKKFDTVLYEEDDGVAIVTLNRPEVHNAFDQKMQAELREIWLMLRSRVEVRVVILTGAGEKAFCSGIDRTEAIDVGYIQDEEAREKMNFATGFVSTHFQYNDAGLNINPKSNELWKPVVAAINGMACGGALYMLGDILRPPCELRHGGRLRINPPAAEVAAGGDASCRPTGGT